MIPITNWRGHTIGYIDKDIYYTTRDASKGQIFNNPKYFSAVGLSVSVIKQLIRNKVKKLCYLITNFDKEDFNAIIDFDEFLKKSKEYQAKGQNADKQRILSLKEFTRVYLNQRKLE